MKLAQSAAFWMSITGFLSVLITVIAKSFGGVFHPYQVMFFYCVSGAVFLLPITLVHYSHSQNTMCLKNIRWRYHIVRAVLEFTGFSFTFYSIMQLPLPTYTSIGYTTPIFATLFAVIFVKERLRRRVIASLLLGIIGIFIVYNPFTTDISSAQTLGVAAALSAAVIFGFCGSLIKLSTLSTPPLLIAVLMLLLTSVVAAPFAYSVWQPILPGHWVTLAFMGITVATVQYGVSRALTLGMISKLVPLMYLNLIWASIFAYFFFDELIEPRTIFGSLFIFSAIIVVSYRRKKKLEHTIIAPKADIL